MEPPETAEPQKPQGATSNTSSDADSYYWPHSSAWNTSENRLRVVRQLHYSLHNQLCIDFVLFLNGLPLATIELKTDTTQNIEDAVRQYKYDRNPVDLATKQPEPLLSFGKRALVHFAVSTDEVQMATKLAGAATRFLPFNRGNPDGMGGAGAGNPPDDALGYSTGYLWHEVFQRDAWLAVVGKFLSVEVSEDAKGKKVFNTLLLFPRYHQWDAVNKLLNATLAEGVGQTYIAMAGGKDGVDSKRAVIDVESKAEIETHEVRNQDDPEPETTMESKTSATNNGERNAAAISTEQLPPADQGRTGEDAAIGDGNRQPVDAGVARTSEGIDRGKRVSSSAESARGSGEAGVQRAGQSSSGTPRDSGTVRPEQRSADTVDQPTQAADPATAETSSKPEIDPGEDFTIDAGDIGKGGLTKKYRDNILAIRILKTMAAEGRKATPQERKDIAKYVGWGALKGVFDRENKQWSKEYAELRDLLTDAEYKAARASTLNAHFTSPDVVGAIFGILDRLGFQSGRVLEPSVGVGNFFGLMPAAMRKQSQLHGVELDPLTSQIVAALYPSARIEQATGFQDFDPPSGYFDVAIGNPPFGSEPIVDDARSQYSGFSIHNYFFAKSIDKLRPGGVMPLSKPTTRAAGKSWSTRRAGLSNCATTMARSMKLTTSKGRPPTPQT